MKQLGTSLWPDLESWENSDLKRIVKLVPSSLLRFTIYPPGVPTVCPRSTNLIELMVPPTQGSTIFYVNGRSQNCFGPTTPLVVSSSSWNSPPISANHRHKEMNIMAGRHPQPTATLPTLFPKLYNSKYNSIIPPFTKAPAIFWSRTLALVSVNNASSLQNRRNALQIQQQIVEQRALYPHTCQSDSCAGLYISTQGELSLI